MNDSHCQQDPSKHIVEIENQIKWMLCQHIGKNWQCPYSSDKSELVIGALQVADLFLLQNFFAAGFERGLKLIDSDPGDSSSNNIFSFLKREDAVRDKLH